MRRSTTALLGCLCLALLACPALGDGSSPTLSEFFGFSWETGGFPNSAAGDELEVVGWIDQLSVPLQWDPATYQYTLHLGGLISTGQEEPDPQNIDVHYVGGRLGIYEDPLLGGTPADPGTDPPNTTAPGSFIDGVNYLRGALADFTLHYNHEFNAGAFEADLDFDSGSHLGELGPQTTGFVFGGVFEFGSPDGYDLHWQGHILLDRYRIEAATWSAVKSHFEGGGR